MWLHEDAVRDVAVGAVLAFGIALLVVVSLLFGWGVR